MALRLCLIGLGFHSARSLDREYYTVRKFAKLVDREQYKICEWCRQGRIIAEKQEIGRGDAKAWKIPMEELNRFRDHGLLTQAYYR